MPPSAIFDEISVLIPGYSAEDLPRDLAEEPASSLLNSISVAWHPAVISCARGIPVLRHAGSIDQLTGRRIVLIPTPSEDFLPHGWQQDPGLLRHLLIHSCLARDQWLAAVSASLSPDSSTPAGLPGPAEFRAAAEFTGPAEFTQPAAAIAPEPVLVDQFLAFGTTWLMVVLLSRRRHHFADPDETTLVREIHLAAEASLRADVDSTTSHLRKCFELLLETREHFYPLSCCLLDVCIPAADSPLPELIATIRDTPHLNLIASVSQLATWSQNSPEFRQTVRDRAGAGQLCLMTGHLVEVRSSLVSMAALLHDLEAGARRLQREFGLLPKHWSRRRFGLLSSLPMILHHMGYTTAFHVALDDGLYPDRECTQFDWQAPDDSTVAATSRIPLAVDSAASMLRFSDRFNESMQDDSPATLLLARLPELQTPWLQDLRIAASFAPVLGEFATCETLTSICSGSRHRQRFEHGEYLSPGLIQSAVLKTESPVSGPAALHQLWMQTLAVSVQHALLVMLQPGHVAPDAATRLRQVRDQQLELERLHAEIPTNPVDVASQQTEMAAELTAQLTTLQSEFSRQFLAAIPHESCTARGLLILNPLPFRRDVLVPWNSTWRLPESNSAIQALARSTDGPLLRIQLPPGGFLWLTESDEVHQRPPHPWLVTARREPPLAEELILRNQHFTILLSDVTGGISSVIFHQSRVNRLSQQVSFRFEHDLKLKSGDGETGDGKTGDGKTEESTSYARPRLISSRTVRSGPLLGEVESLVEILSPADGSVLAVCRQFTAVDRYSPRISIRLVFDSITRDVIGHPWLTYFTCRFAWENENASIARSVLGQVADFRGERIETADYFEVADGDHRFAVCTHGMPYHRRTSRRTADCLLICEHEEAREFRLTVDFDQPVPIRCAAVAQVPPIILETTDLRPVATSTAWLLGVTARNVMLVSITADPAPDSAGTSDAPAAGHWSERSPESGLAGVCATPLSTPETSATGFTAATDVTAAGPAETSAGAGEDPLRHRPRLRLVLCETEGLPVDCVLRTARAPKAAFRKSLGDSVSEPLLISETGVSLHFSKFQLKEIELIF